MTARSPVRRGMAPASLPAALVAGVSLAVLVAATAARAAPPGGGDGADLRRLFRQEASITAPSGRLVRLDLPAEVLGACRPDLSDLRLFDAAGVETPFVVDAGAPPSTATELVEHARPEVVDVARHEIRRESGPPLRRETITLALPAKPPRTGGWALLFQTGVAEFVARVTIESIDAGGTATPLVPEGSIFRLPAMHGAERTRILLPPVSAPRLRVTLESETPSYLEPTLGLESARRVERAGSVAVPLAVLSATHRDGATIIDLARPPGIVPDRLRVETSTPLFDRGVEATDEGPAGAGRIGSGRLFRFPGPVAAGDQELGLSRARGERIRVRIDDGDSPPLESPSFAAVIRQPGLIFILPAGAGPGASATLRFGGGRAHPPRYDLAGLIPPAGVTVGGSRAEAAALLEDPAALPAARLGAVAANPDYDGAPALQFALHPGAAVDASSFSHRRAIEVRTAAEGLSRVTLEAEDLAILADGAADLRIVDASGRQWSWLAADDAPASVPLTVDAPRTRDRRSSYRLGLPVAAIPLDRLTLDPEGGFVDRSFRLEARVDDREARPIASGRLTRPIDDRRPITIDFPAARSRALTLEVDDGDDAPLAFRSIVARAPRPAVYLAAPVGRYEMLLGAPDQKAPRYELERARAVVLSVRAEPVAAGPLETNPRQGLAARWVGPGARRTLLLWGTILAAVLVLGLLTLRLARRETPAA